MKVKQINSKCISLIIKTIILVVVLAIALLIVIPIHRMTGNEMSPFVRDGDLCVFYGPGSAYLNDVVLYDGEDGHRHVGRIVARGGQTVTVNEQGGYTVDDYEQTEEIPYVTKAAEEGIQYPITLKEDEYFILNDFRTLTTDSRETGAVKRSKIKGRLIFLFRRRNF